MTDIQVLILLKKKYCTYVLNMSVTIWVHSDQTKIKKHNVWYHYISALSSDKEHKNTMCGIIIFTSALSSDRGHKNTMELELVNISPLIVYELELNFSSSSIIFWSDSGIRIGQHITPHSLWTWTKF